MSENSRKIRLALAMGYPLHQQGGVEVLMREIVRRLSTRFEIFLVSNDRDRAALGEPFASLVTAHLHWDSQTKDRASARALCYALAEQRIDLAHLHGGQYDWQTDRVSLSPLYLLAKRGVPVVYTNHLVLPLLSGYCRSNRPDWQKLLLLPRAWINRARVLRLLDAEVLVSRHDHEEMRRNFFPFAGKLFQIYHSQLSSATILSPGKAREKTILCLGTFAERKGQTFLASAFARVAQENAGWKVVMMGRVEIPEYLEEVKAIAAQSHLTDRIIIAPATPNPSPCLDAASIIVMPSLIEPLGLSLQEALFHECAAIGSAVGGIPELIDDGKTGLLVPPGDVDALADALNRLMKSQELRTTMGRAARQSIFDKGMLAESMIENYTSLYARILADRKGRS